MTYNLWSDLTGRLNRAMLKVNTIASKITLMVGGMALLLTIFTGYFFVINNYQLAKLQLISGFESLAISTSNHQQSAIKEKDLGSLKNLFGIFFENKSLRYAALHDVNGVLVFEQKRFQSEAFDPPELSFVKKGAGAFERRTTFGTDLKSGEAVIDMTFPVFSVANQSRQEDSSTGPLKSQQNEKLVRAQHFSGHVRFYVSERDIRDGVFSFAVKVFLVCLAGIALAMTLSISIARRITLPLTTLVNWADDIALGKLKVVTVEGAWEVEQIAENLNLIIENLSEYKIRIDADNKTLELKVEARTKELSVRNKELNQAIEEVTETKNRMRKMAYIDSLTALPNRRYFNEQFQMLVNIAVREKHLLSLIFIDIDNFKRINDSLGHNAGDELLKEVASRLKDSVRESDVVHNEISGKSLVSRFGGDEFTIILHKIDLPESAGIVAQRLLTALRRPMHIDGNEFVITPSIGITLAPAHGEKADLLLKHADTAMYHAKSGGKNNYQYYSSDMAEADVDRLQLETDLRKAIERNELEVHFQPQVNIDTGKIVGAEALLRWRHSELGYVPPLEFIQLAEECGVIGELGDWVLLTTCRYMKIFQKLNLDLKNISVNVSSLQFTEVFVDRLKEVLEITDLAPQALTIELTEGIIMDDTYQMISRLNEVKECGVGLSIDDFGTGFSSLSYLSRFPLDELKIDRSFVVDLQESAGNESLVRAIISMAKSLDLELVAEGVENVEQYKFLKDNGVKVIQGYIFSKPLAPAEFQQLLESGKYLEEVAKIAAL